jgi:hypothetical protein
MLQRSWRLRLPKWFIAAWGIFATLLTVLSLPSVPDEIAKWGPVLSAVDSEPSRWLLPAIGWILLLLLAGGALGGWVRPKRRRGHIEVGEIRSRSISRGPVSVVSDRSDHSQREMLSGGSLRDAIHELSRREAQQRIEEELVSLVDEWKLVRGDAFGEPDYGTFKLWADRTSEFIRRVFGETERQRFESDGPEVLSTLRQSADLRIRALERLRDHPEDWQIQADGQELEEAIASRRRLSPGDRIVLAGTQLSNDVGSSVGLGASVGGVA